MAAASRRRRLAVRSAVIWWDLLVARLRRRRGIIAERPPGERSPCGERAVGAVGVGADRAGNNSALPGVVT